MVEAVTLGKGAVARVEVAALATVVGTWAAAVVMEVVDGVEEEVMKVEKAMAAVE